MKMQQMIAIIPVFFEDDRELWDGAEGKGLMLKTFKSALNARKIKKVIIFTNDNSICNLSKSLNIDSYMIDIETETEKSELLPPGTYSSVRYLQEILKVDFGNLMILNFRNPLITPGLIDEAINKFKVSKTPALISVKKSVDHPVQLNAYYRIVDVGFIHIFDDDKAIDSYVKVLNDHHSTRHHTNQRNQCNPCNLRLDNLHYKLTKPFYFDWETRGVKDKSASGMYIRMYDDLSMKYIPIDQVSDDTFGEISSPLWIYDGHNKARILFQFNKYEKLCREVSRVDKNLHLAGAAFSDNFNHISSLLFKDIKGSEYFLALNSEDLSSSHSYVLRALPVGLSGSLGKGVIEVEIDDLSKPVSLQHEDKDGCGIIYTLLKVAEDDTYDLCEPFPSDERLWTGSIQKINVKTGKEIMGRQDFPDVFEPEGTFFIMRKDLISSFDKEVLNGKADGFIMKDTDSIQVESSFDLLRYRAITRAIGIISI